MRRVVLAVLGATAGTSLLIGAKAGSAPSGSPPAAVASGLADPAAGPLPGAAPGASAGPAASAAPSAARSAGQTGAAAPTAGGACTGAVPAGTYVVTGSTVQTKYGPVQVRISASGCRITDVVAIRLPTAESRSIQIDNRAVPILRQEALTAQSARINTVSGATYTSNGYRSSLQSALDAAARGQRS